MCPLTCKNFLIAKINRNSKATKFSPSSRFRTMSHGSHQPGPGTYEHLGNIEKKGPQHLSQYKSVAVRRFGTA